MQLSEWLALLRTDLGDPDSLLLADAALERCLIRALAPVSQDTGHSLALVDGEIVPAPDGLVAEGLLLLAASYACSMMRGKTANAVNVSSGDKRIERTSQAKYWAELEADLLSRYRQCVSAGQRDDLFITPPRVRPVRYEQGSEV